MGGSEERTKGGGNRKKGEKKKIWKSGKRIKEKRGTREKVIERKNEMRERKRGRGGDAVKERKEKKEGEREKGIGTWIKWELGRGKGRGNRGLTALSFTSK